MKLIVFFLFMLIILLIYMFNLTYKIISKDSKMKINKINNTFIQIFIECKNYFIPPIKEIPSHRIQCTTPIAGYECGESKAYLEFVIDNYDNPLADIYVFMHGHNYAWHYINPLKKTMKKLINSNYIKEEKFGGFQCYWNYSPTIVIDDMYMKLFKILFNNTSVKIDKKGNWSYPCCGTFFVHTDQIKLRPKSEYIQMIENLKMWTNRDIQFKKEYGNQYDGYCGRIYEMMWHRILSFTTYIKLPPYCKTEERMGRNPIITSDDYKKIYK